MINDNGNVNVNERKLVNMYNLQKYDLLICNGNTYEIIYETCGMVYDQMIIESCMVLFLWIV